MLLVPLDEVADAGSRRVVEMFLGGAQMLGAVPPHAWVRTAQHAAIQFKQMLQVAERENIYLRGDELIGVSVAGHQILDDRVVDRIATIPQARIDRWEFTLQ